MKKFIGLTVLALACAPAFAQDATLTAREAGSGKTVVSDGGTLPDTVCFYGGDFDTRNGLSSERGTLVSDSWTFDDIDWAGGTVATGWFNFLDTGIGTPSGADVIFYSGMSEGNFGSVVGSATDAAVTTAPTGGSGFGYPEIKASWDLAGQAFSAAAGTYHVGMRIVGTGAGQCFISTASGTNGVGTPLANGNVYFQSTHFGYPVPTDAQNVFGAGNWDMSRGLDCGGGGCPSDFTATKGGSCPGGNSLTWSGAPANSSVRVVYTSNGGSGGTIPPNSPCPGTTLCIGLAGVTLHPQVLHSNGSGSGSIPNFSAPCGLHLQLITQSSCKTSNAVTL